MLLSSLAALLGRRRIAVAAVALAAVNAVGLLPGVLAGSRPDPRDPQLRLLVANISYPSDEYARLVDLVERENPDVVGLIELTDDWARGVDSGLAGYSHRLLELATGYGIGIYSRLPLLDARLVDPGGGWPPVAVATLAVDGRRVELFVVHGPSAVTPRAAARHREYMRDLGELVHAAGDSALVCGDVNAAPWTGPYQELRDRGGLERGDAWRPFEGTYPVWSSFLRVPIDQCLAGAALAVSWERGPAIGSDHFPIIVSVGF